MIWDKNTHTLHKQEEELAGASQPKGTERMATLFRKLKKEEGYKRHDEKDKRWTILRAERAERAR